MKKFEFRFESVAKVRLIEMERQARALAVAQMKVKKIEDEIAEIWARQDEEVQRQKRVIAEGRFEEQLVHLSDRFRSGLKKVLTNKRNELRDAENQVTIERDKLLEKERRRKVIEKVRERDLETYEEERKKDETKIMDEVAGLALQRSHREP